MTSVSILKKERSLSFAPWPYFAQDEIDAAAAVLKSGKVNYWTGEEGRLFEKEFSAFTGCDYAVALANGTVALELVLYALGIGQGDDVGKNLSEGRHPFDGEKQARHINAGQKDE